MFDPRGGHWMGGRYVPSLLAALGEVIEQHLIDTGFIASPDAEDIAVPQVKAMDGTGSGTGSGSGHSDGRPSGARTCPRCSQPALLRQEGCDTCVSCGYSKCG